MENNYRVIYENLPYSVDGFVLYSAVEEYYTIVLNNKVSYQTNLKTFKHEIKHIQNRDFDKCKSVTLLEAVRHS